VRRVLCGGETGKKHTLPFNYLAGFALFRPVRQPDSENSKHHNHHRNEDSTDVHRYTSSKKTEFSRGFRVVKKSSYI
jgi:hypothetical protein